MVKDTSCVFCKIVAGAAPAHIVYEDAFTIAFLDKYPRTRGHLQLVPKQHYRWIYELPDMGAFFTTSQRIIRGIIPVLRADHVTLSSFGHEVTHAHLWIVPQYAERVTVSERSRQSNGSDQEQIAQILRNEFLKGV